MLGQSSFLKIWYQQLNQQIAEADNDDSLKSLAKEFGRLRELDPIVVQEELKAVFGLFTISNT